MRLATHPPPASVKPANVPGLTKYNKSHALEEMIHPHVGVTELIRHEREIKRPIMKGKVIQPPPCLRPEFGVWISLWRVSIRSG